jgi:pilus assembly protein CpaE
VRNIGAHGGATSVALVGLDAEAAGQARELLSAEAAIPPGAIGFGDALGALKRQKPDLAIVMFTGNEAMALATAIKRDLPDLVLVAMAKKSDAGAILQAMRAGFKEFVVLPDDAARLRQAVREARGGSAGTVDEDKGVVVAFAGAKGGVGTSMIAANLAAEFAGIHRVLLIDMNLSTGDVGSVLDVPAKETICDLLAKLERLDERVLGNTVSVHRSKVHALLTPDDPTTVENITADGVLQLVATAATAYQYVFIDCGTYFDEAVGVALNVADHVVLITTPDVIAVRDAFRRVKAWQQLGLDKSRIRLVVNRWSKTAFLQLKDIEQNLGVPVGAVVADDSRTVDQALNEGKLLRDVNKKSDVMRDVATLVGMLTDEASEPVGGSHVSPSGDKPSGVGGFFASLFNRG